MPEIPTVLREFQLYNSNVIVTKEMPMDDATWEILQISKLGFSSHPIVIDRLLSGSVLVATRSGTRKYTVINAV
jgi:hypothetical protein